MTPTLVTISFSHYCDKARWALDLARIAYREDAHLPAFHLLPVKRAGGKRTTPTLVTGEGVLADSTDILAWVDRQRPDLGLYGRSAEERREIARLEDRFDEALGPHARRWAYRHLLPDRGFAMAMFGAYRRGETWASADGSFQWQEGIAAGAGTTDLAIPPTRSSLLGVRAGHRLGSRVSLLARARWIHDASTGRREQIVPGLGTYRIDLPERTDRIALRLSENIELGGGSSVRITVGRQWAFNEATQDRYESPLDQTRRRSDVMSSFEVVTTVADGPRTWVAGARAEAERLEQRLTGMELVGGGLSTSDWNEVPGRTLGSGAVYAQLAYRVHPSLTIMPGARAEVHLRYGGVVVPRLSIAYLPGPAWTLRLSGGGGFRAPSAKEMGFSFDHSIYGYRVVGNPDLLPERSWGLSGDVAFRPTPAFTVRAGGFANWVTRLIDLVLVPDSMKAGVSDYTYQNLGAGRTSGAQVDMVYQVATWLRAEAGYAYLWTRDDTHERPLQGRPPHTIVASMRAELPFRVELFARWRGVTDAFIDERTRTPAYSTLDARIARPLWPSSLAYVGVQNALDIRRDPSLAGDQRPIAGRTFYVGLTAELPLEDTP